MRLRLSSLAAATCLAVFPIAAHAESGVGVSLEGSRASMRRQNRIAKAESYSFLRTPAQVRRFVDDGRLVPLAGNADYDVIASYPYARGVVRSFVERIAADYHDACNERLVVTSLTRPVTRQPRNASPLSVHPAGMAVDLRVSRRAACSRWLRRELLSLEERGVLDATLEHAPLHFHIAVFPEAYVTLEGEFAADSAEAEAAQLATATAAFLEQLTPPDLDPEIVTPEPAAEPAHGSLLTRVAALVALLFLPILV